MLMFIVLSFYISTLRDYNIKQNQTLKLPKFKKKSLMIELL